ncbi:MAG: helix-turn-helix transcriptional regulator [Dehalococcoidales bacterium]|nr:helix-turn-helix transcriptional regulator [Dehalococcoidales bacterium]
MMEETMTITVRVNKLALLRAIARRNMSQNMLAIKVGSSSGYISQIMCGTRTPSPRMREKLLNVLAPLTFDDIFIIEESDNGSKHE